MTFLRSTALPLIAVMAAAHLTSVQAAETSLGAVTWTATGAAGLIGATPTVPLSPEGSDPFGYVTTAGGAGHYGSADNVSPLILKADGKGNEGNNNGSIVISSAFSARAADTLTLHFNYVSTDGRGYDDYAWARLVDAGTRDTAAWLFTARSSNNARGNVVPGDVLKRQQDNGAPDRLDAVLNDGDSIGFNVTSTVWSPLGGFSGYCWDDANTCGPTGWIRSNYTFARSADYYLELGVVNWGDEIYDSALAFDFAGLTASNFANVMLPAVPEPRTYALMLAGLFVVAAMGRRQRARSEP